jgi:hypothetical protein
LNCGRDRKCLNCGRDRDKKCLNCGRAGLSLLRNPSSNEVSAINHIYESGRIDIHRIWKKESKD